ncbi:Protein kinase domain [Arabidopsis suecica]|uniref:Protein kinase domain n=1 Tax=Arabidopsis suecica TaxID=45249 RepID=A0A8T2AQM1_ARASU|nr:Protein kinase domain [Arabidopsis suecica]
MLNLKLFLELKLCFLITVLCSSHTTSSVSDTFFINCGSPTNVTVNNRTFVSDNNLVQGISVGTTDSNSGDESTLFQTARVFSDESSTYRFPIEKHGWFLIRLYFLPLVSASQDLTTARFSVLAQNFTLIRDYKPSTTSVVKEYSLNISNDNLSLEFRREAGSIAFINALEVFRLPENLIPEDAKLIGTQKDLKLRSHAMETVSRVNMGNLSVTRDQDKLWRQWDSDSAYKAQFGTPVMNLEAVNFSAGGITDDIAPLYVYGTATRLNSDDPRTNANLTWTFKIDPGFDYFVRFHFCNILVDPFGFEHQIRFDVFVNSEKARSVDMTEVANGTFGAPFFVDAVMRKARSQEGFLNLSIGSVIDLSPVSFINGVEILKLSNDKRSLDAFDAVFPDGSSRNKSSNTRIGLIAGLSAALCVALVFGVVVVWWCIGKRRRRNRQMQTVHSRGDDHQIKNNEKPGESLIFSSSKIGYRYPLALIKEATDDFDDSLVIGVGGFGKVYKGVLRDKTEIAVKRGAPQSRQGLAEFKTEIEMLTQFRHRHLVSLIGYCDENSEMIIVYEYMEKGTLKNHLYDSDDNPRLSWRQRLEICVGAARGLHYLHTGSTRAIIHRDVKSANILLDENFMAKVADFGLSKTGPDLDQTHVSTAVKGSFGYLDPEYLTRQQLTEKSDVYSFGVVMLEVVCGRPVIDPSLPREKVNLIEWAMKLVKKGKLEDIIDPFLEGKVKLEEVKKYCEITEKCLSQNGIERPTMGDLLWNLEFMLQVQAKDEKAAIVDDKPEASVVGSTMQFSVNGVGDIAGVSMSKVFAQMVREETR